MPPLSGIGRRLGQGLAKTRQAFARLLVVQDTDEVEELLLAGDVGVRASTVLAQKVKHAGQNRRQVLEQEIAGMLMPGVKPREPSCARPQVIMIVGVNGSGKTTTVGKLCHRFSKEGKKVVVAAADTYRDAASDQLGIWAERAGVEIVSSAKGQDAAAVAFDTISRAVKRDMDLVLVDTAGRLHTRTDLMAEVEKIKRVCGRVRDGAPDEIWLVLDATVGQNGLRQARAFDERLGLTGLIVAKLDGTARGGVLVPIVMELGLPVRFVGIGEGLEDIEPFEPKAFARALFES
ncbi:MAG: signal recognition particle-docking protein FtsY [candidate division WOR-3 bacterium]|nr:MAG: signal recognition particle-docking protein FtsY [candidate division WOR-3 bacterium]